MTSDKLNEIYTQLKKLEMLKYNAKFTESFLQCLSGIEVPAIGTRQTYNAISLAQLEVVTYLRDRLLPKGKYLSQCNGEFRVLTPSENIGQVNKYLDAADRKIKRAVTLNRETKCATTRNNKSSSAFSKLESIKSKIAKNNLLN